MQLVCRKHDSGSDNQQHARPRACFRGIFSIPEGRTVVVPRIEWNPTLPADRLARACIPVIENLEDRRMFAVRTVQALPYIVDFNSDRGELHDKDGERTGFTRVQANKNGNEYQSALIDLDTALGVLKLTSTG